MITLKPLNGLDLPCLQSVLEQAPRYSINISGERPTRTAAQETVKALPPNKEYEDKFVFGIYADQQMIGCMDLIRGYPDPKTAMLGLLLLSEEHQGKGVGTKAFSEIEKIAHSWTGIEKIRISVVQSNQEVIRFIARST